MDSFLNLWLKNERNLSALSNFRKISILLCTILRKSFCPQGNLSILLLFLVKISAQPNTTLCVQFLDRENNDKSNT